MHPFTSLLALAATVLTACEASDLIPGLIVRQTNTTSAGGFSTRAPACTADQVDCGDGIAQEICCPAGTFCFNSSDTVCCPTNEDCNEQFFEDPKCADPSWYLCTDYAPNIPGYTPNDPGYWCCPTGTQCFVSPDVGFICGAAASLSGDIPASTVLSGHAPTQASTATTFPTVGPTKTGKSSTKTSGGATSSSGTSSNSAIKTSSFLSVPASLGIFVAQAFFALALAAVM